MTFFQRKELTAFVKPFSYMKVYKFKKKIKKVLTPFKKVLIRTLELVSVEKSVS